MQDSLRSCSSCRLDAFRGSYCSQQAAYSLTSSHAGTHYYIWAAKRRSPAMLKPHRSDRTLRPPLCGLGSPHHMRYSIQTFIQRWMKSTLSGLMGWNDDNKRTKIWSIVLLQANYAWHLYWYKGNYELQEAFHNIESCNSYPSKEDLTRVLELQISIKH